MATTRLTPAEMNQAQAAINRLAGQAASGGRFPQVTPRSAQENPAMTVRVDIHDGPLGHGRTIVAEYRKGVFLVRRTQGEGAHGVSADWRDIDLSKLGGVL